ncbi:MAG: glycosyltransferase family 2 protein [Dissulfurispiraceae bacterium]
MSELVSILIPAYNAEKWIGDTVKSALSQNWPRKEVIIVNDGSSDNTLMIASGFESPSVKVLTQDNKGASSARNKALSVAQGDYIQWLDADDLLAPDKISQQLRDSRDGCNSRILLSSAWGKFYYRHWRAKFVPNILWQNLSPAEWILRKLDENAWMSIESWLVSRKLTEMAGLWDEGLSMDDDGEYFRRVITSSEQIIFVIEAKSYCRRVNKNSISSDLKISNKKLDSQFVSICRHIESLRTLDDGERARVACLKYLQRWLIYFYPERQDIVERAFKLAEELGGSLLPPTLSWKYSLVRKFLGWGAARKAQFMLPKVRVQACKIFDGLLYGLSIR